MKKQIDSILIVNKYLVSHKNNSVKSGLIRGYLKIKLNRALRSKKPTYSLNFLDIPLRLLTL